MRSHLPRLFRLLRASFLAMLVSGLMIGPVLTQLSELHAVEHSIATATATAIHDHGPNADEHPHDQPSQGSGADHGSDGDGHSAGAHGLMHQSGGSTTLTGLVSALSVPMTFARMPDLPIPALAGTPSQSPASPFRPPIA